MNFIKLYAHLNLNMVYLLQWIWVRIGVLDQINSQGTEKSPTELGVRKAVAKDKVVRMIYTA